MKFDEILKHVGEFGKYQKQKYVLLIGAWVLTAPFMMMSVFVMGIPKHRELLKYYKYSLIMDVSVKHMDGVFEHVGEFGVYQKRLYSFIVVSWILAVPFMLIDAFNTFRPEHRCQLPNHPNDTYALQDPEHRELVHLYIPDSHDISKGAMSTISTSHWSQTVPVQRMPPRAHVPHGYTAMSILTIHLYRSIGRRMTLITAIIIHFACSLSLAWSPSYTVYVILRFAIGMCNVGMFMTSYVIGMEWVGPSKRTFVGLVIALIGPFGELMLLLASYFIRQWKYVEIAMAIPVAFYSIMWWFIPESPRWLVSKGRIEEARKLLKKAAEVNKQTLPDKLLEDLAPDEKKAETGKIWLLFTAKVLVIRTLIIYYNWMVASMVFYGLSLNIGILYGDFYINFLISALVEFPGHLLPLFLIDRFGRRKSHCGFMFVGGLGCLCTIFTVNFGGQDLQWLTTTLAMVGKLFSTAAFATIYVISAEIFPTVVRNAGMGSSSCWARVGGMISPFIADTKDLVGGKIGTAVPLVIFGAASLLAGALTLALPETLNRTLPETIQDGKHYGRKEKEPEFQTVEMTKY